MMDRRAFIAMVVGSVFAAPPVSWAQRSTPQRAGVIPVIGILHAGVPDPATPAIAASSVEQSRNEDYAHVPAVRKLSVLADTTWSGGPV